MKLRLMILTAVLATAATAAAQTDDLLISEYVAGTGNNKAVEIFNGTADTVNLAGYHLGICHDGAAICSDFALLPVDLDPGEVFVVAHAGFAAPDLADVQYEIGRAHV